MRKSRNSWRSPLFLYGLWIFCGVFGYLSRWRNARCSFDLGEFLMHLFPFLRLFLSILYFKLNDVCFTAWKGNTRESSAAEVAMKIRSGRSEKDGGRQGRQKLRRRAKTERLRVQLREHIMTTTPEEGGWFFNALGIVHHCFYYSWPISEIMLDIFVFCISIRSLQQ